MSLLAITVLQLVELSGTIYVIMAVDHYLAVRSPELVDIGVREGGLNTKQFVVYSSLTSRS